MMSGMMSLFIPVARSNRTLLVSVLPVLMATVSFLTGCTSASLKMDPPASEPVRKELPVKFNFSTITWTTTSGLPNWFDKPKISMFITKVKQRAPELFSNGSQTVPLTFFIEHSKVNITNQFMNFLSVITLFILPTPLTEENTFIISVRAGDKGEYSRKCTVKIVDRTFLSLIPFLAFLLPPQSGYFCHGFVNIGNNALDRAELQNVFLNLIYSLDNDRLRKLHDDKFGEKIELLGPE